MRRDLTFKELLQKTLLFLLVSAMFFCFVFGLTICVDDFTANAAVLSAYINMPEVSVQLIQKGLNKAYNTQEPSSDIVSPSASSDNNSDINSQNISSNSTPQNNSSAPDSETSSETNTSSEEVIRPENSGDILEEQFPSVVNSSSYALFGSGCIHNYTSLTIDYINELLQTESSLTLIDTAEPQVLIVHTHATESFQLNDYDFYLSDYNARSTDSSVNMVAIGNEIEELLKEAGIGVIHDTIYHDYPSYNRSYDRSEETIQGYLDEYPTIQVVLDVHRDAIERDNGVRVKPTTEIDSEKAAQIMIIAGCDNGTLNMPNWAENFRFAAALQDQLETMYPTITRPLMLDYRNYNQHLTKASILIEVGGHANTLKEAKYSAELLGNALVELFGDCMS